MFEIEPIDKFLTVLKGEEWKSIRSIVTTTFTSGKLKTVRIKFLYFFLIQVSLFIQTNNFF